ncbi:hypothetical protein F5051DRAFT_446604 [Lentinula edodes]|nr:hypothetical protein F5051DRAFT_446604 [Lentinula edodes]
MTNPSKNFSPPGDPSLKEGVVFRLRSAQVVLSTSNFNASLPEKFFTLSSLEISFLIGPRKSPRLPYSYTPSSLNAIGEPPRSKAGDRTDPALLCLGSSGEPATGATCRAFYGQTYMARSLPGAGDISLNWF